MCAKGQCIFYVESIESIIMLVPMNQMISLYASSVMVVLLVLVLLLLLLPGPPLPEEGVVLEVGRDRRPGAGEAAWPTPGHQGDGRH